ncbi:unnamed protein product [Strongylus vulgaris]|uniref:Endonuclease/exonuclease/phosphatase domain-containing protein n=1 Tax=Strongylus vulgaris TaxID=40348 RepID=A0A3P7JQB1_STRVU|nr:unnamed protein product [Strongylus vulgaris]
MLWAHPFFESGIYCDNPGVVLLISSRKSNFKAATTMDWRVVIITYNVNMQRGDESDVEKLLAPAIATNPHLLVVGMQEVSHGETVVGGTMDWRVVIITYNVNMQRGDESDVEKLLAPAIATNPHLLVVGMQEVSHGETVVGGTVITWQRQMFEWMNTRTDGLVLLAKTYQMTNQVTVFVKRTLIPLGLLEVQPVSFCRVQSTSRNTMGGLTGHKGSIGIKISLQVCSSYRSYFVVLSLAILLQHVAD